MILLVNYHLFVFHYYEQEPVPAYNIGWCCIALISFMIAINIFLVLAHILRNLKLTLRRALYRLLFRKESKTVATRPTMMQKNRLFNSDSLQTT